MRDYSKPWYVLDELAAAFKGVCASLSIKDISVVPDIAFLGSQVSSVAARVGLTIGTSGDLGTVACNLQRLIVFLLESGIVSEENLQTLIDNELKTIPTSPFVDYFTGEMKIPAPGK